MLQVRTLLAGLLPLPPPVRRDLGLLTVLSTSIVLSFPALAKLAVVGCAAENPFGIARFPSTALLLLELIELFSGLAGLV